MTDPIADIRAGFAPLLEEAEGALERRESQYPALVEAGRMEGPVAATEIRIWRAIVADWRAIVTGTAASETHATIEEKVAILTDAVARYGPALNKAIANETETVRRDCADIRDRAYLRDLHGKKPGVARYLDLLASQGRIEDVLDVYRSEQPGNRAWRGLWRGIAEYLAYHQHSRANRQQQRAA